MEQLWQSSNFNDEPFALLIFLNIALWLRNFKLKLRQIVNASDDVKLLEEGFNLMEESY